MSVAAYSSMRDAGLATLPGNVERMTIKTYVAVLHEGSVPTSAGEPVVCPLQPDGNPKSVLDHHGVIFRLMEQKTSVGFFNYQRDAQASSLSIDSTP